MVVMVMANIVVRNKMINSTNTVKQNQLPNQRKGMKVIAIINNNRKQMKRKFQIEGISCGGCVERVKRILEEHPAVQKTEIFLYPEEATIISMKEKLTVEDLQHRLDILEGYTITEIN